jgi:putative redox protein
MNFIGETGSGHSVVMDGAPDGGGANMGLRPMEMLLLGLGGCSAYDVVLILQRGRHMVQHCSVHIQATRAPKDPKVFTSIHLQFRIAGDDLPIKAVERAIALSHEKYCSASIMLAKATQITTGYDLV